MKIVATVQARMGSTRLPGKVLKRIVGRPMLALQIERIQQSRLIDEIVVATTTEPQDEAIVALARDLGVAFFRGSENDVVSRIVGALKAFAADLHVEFMGDNPIPDALLVDAVIGYYLKFADKYDYVTNALTTTYPPGAEVFVYPAAVLYDAESRITEAALREHVGIHIFRHPERYRLCNLPAPPWYHYPDMHLEVDTPEDFAVISAIFEHFSPHNPGFSLSQVIEFMTANPVLLMANKQVERRWKAFRQD
jgi:spore coat polysaccharide biosynthesis protein SpsF